MRARDTRSCNRGLMDKTENNDTEQQTKRPSARRHTPEPIEQPNVGKQRVHARRTLNLAEPASDSRPRAPRPQRASARTTVSETGAAEKPRRVRASARDEVAVEEGEADASESDAPGSVREEVGAL